MRGPEPVAPPGTLHPHEIENGIWDPAAQNLHFPYPGLFDFLLRTWYFEEPRVPNFVVRNIVTNIPVRQFAHPESLACASGAHALFEIPVALPPTLESARTNRAVPKLALSRSKSHKINVTPITFCLGFSAARPYTPASLQRCALQRKDFGKMMKKDCSDRAFLGPKQRVLTSSGGAASPARTLRPAAQLAAFLRQRLDIVKRINRRFRRWARHPKLLAGIVNSRERRPFSRSPDSSRETHSEESAILVPSLSALNPPKRLSSPRTRFITNSM